MTTALILVDAQRNMLEGDDPVPECAEVRGVLESLLGSARSHGAMVVHVQNDGQAGDPDEPGGEGWELVFPPDDDEIVVRKSEPNAFAPDPQLARTLQAEGVDRIVLAGMQSEFCVRETSLGALHAGFGVSLPKGAHATYGATASDAAALSASVEKGLEDEGVRVVDLSAVEF